MNPSPRLPLLRYALSQAFRRHHQSTGVATPGLHHLLPVPIRERLVLLASIDGADPKAIRKALPVSRADAEMTSPEMQSAIHTWRQTLDDAYWAVPERANWRFQRQGSVDKVLRQLVWADAAVALIGDGALPEVVSSMSLRRRLIAYCLVVEETTRRQTEQLFGGTEWEIKEAIRTGLEVTKGGK